MLWSAIQKNAERHSDAVALRMFEGSEDRKMSYGELASLVSGLAKHLLSRGVCSGDYVGVYMNKSEASVIAMLAANAVGATFFPIHRHLPWQQVQGLLERTKCRLLVIEPSTAYRMAEADSRVSLLALSLEQPAPRQQDVVRRVGAELLVLKEHTDTPFETSRASTPTEVCALFTSGSTGKPKGVVVGSDDLMARAQSEIRTYGLTRDDRLLSVLPFAFDVGFNQLVSGLVSGAEIVLRRSWFGPDVASTIAVAGVTGFSGTPHVWIELLQIPHEELAVSLASLRFAALSGGNMALSQLERIYGLGFDFYKTYGQTETFRSTALGPADRQAIGQKPQVLKSVGRPLPDVTLRVVDAEGNDAPNGTTGTVVHAGVGTMVRYIDESVLTNASINTGDQGYFDELGYLYLCGRADQMIKIKDFRVYPQQAASVIEGFEGVRETVVLGEQTDAHDGHLVAFVETDADPAQLEQELRRQLGQRLPPYMIPKQIVVLERFERTSTGKPDLVKLRSNIDS